MADRCTPPMRRRCAARRQHRCLRPRKIKKRLQQTAVRRAAIRAGIFTARATVRRTTISIPLRRRTRNSRRPRLRRNLQRSRRRRRLQRKRFPRAPENPGAFSRRAEQKLDRSASRRGESAARCAGNGRRDSAEKISIVCRYLARRQSFSRSDRPLPRYGVRGKRQACPRTTGL